MVCIRRSLQAKLNASRQHVEALKDRTKNSGEENNTKIEAQVKLDQSGPDVSNPLVNTPLPPPVTPANQARAQHATINLIDRLPRLVSIKLNPE